MTIINQPYSDHGRDEHDRIFRKKPTAILVEIETPTEDPSIHCGECHGQLPVLICQGSVVEMVCDCGTFHHLCGYARKAK
jgi:hypothetical protein